MHQIDFDLSLYEISKIEGAATLDLSVKNYNPGAVLHTISQAKNELVTATEYPQYARGYFQETVARVYLAYQKLLYNSEALDFDDLLMKTVQLFQKNPEVLGKYQEKYHYVLVDEYQDTNTAQYQIIKLLADKYKNIFDKYAVGGYNQVASSLQNMGSDTKVTYRLKGMNRDTVTMLSYLGDTLKQDMAEVGTNTQFSNTPTSLSASNAMLDDAKNINNTSSGKNISPEVSPMPSTPSSTQGGGNQVASNQGQMIPVPTPNMEKSDRKLKSDNDLLNHQIDYGDIV